MRKPFMTVAAALLAATTTTIAQTASAPARQAPTGESPQRSATFDPALTGTWRSAPDQMKLTSDFDKSVWGADATSVRTVELVVGKTGEGMLRITRKVVDARGRTAQASTWVEEAQLKIGGAVAGSGPRVEHDTAVVSAVRLFPDDKEYRWTIEGLRVKVVTFTDGDGSMEVRYDTPEGRGSFWETLRRDRAAGKAPR